MSEEAVRNAGSGTVISTLDELRTLYREPSDLVRNKVKSELEPVSAEFIGLARFVLLATSGPDGRLDVSPRGGPEGFVRVDGGRILIPDLNGNNLLDTLQNVVTVGRIGAMFVRPGMSETVRVNGRAHVTVAEDVLDGFTSELRRPKCAVVIEPDEVFIHCAKSFRRGGVWDPGSWATEGPDGIDVLRGQLGIEGDDGPMREMFAAGYAKELAED